MPKISHVHNRIFPEASGALLVSRRLLILMSGRSLSGPHVSGTTWVAVFALTYFGEQRRVLLGSDVGWWTIIDKIPSITQDEPRLQYNSDIETKNFHFPDSRFCNDTYQCNRYPISYTIDKNFISKRRKVVFHKICHNYRQAHEKTINLEVFSFPRDFGGPLYAVCRL